MMGETKLLRTIMSVKGTIFDKYFKEELSFLARYAPNRAKLVHDDITSIQAIGEIIDMTGCLAAGMHG